MLVNTAGGLTGGDRFATTVLAQARTEVILTTQACEKLYRSDGADACVEAHLVLGAGASLCWLPQETILFDGSRLQRSLEARLESELALLVVEAVLLGRRASGERFTRGRLHERWRIRRAGRLVLRRGNASRARSRHRPWGESHARWRRRLCNGGPRLARCRGSAPRPPSGQQ